MIEKQEIMFIGAHADDIEAKAGGALAKYRDIGYGIVYVMSTNNMSGFNSTLRGDGTIESKREKPLDMMNLRKRECDAAAKMLGTKPVHLDHPQRHYWSEEEGRQVELRYGCPLPEGVEADVPSILTAHEDPASVGRVCRFIIDHDPCCILTHPVASLNIEHMATALLTVKGFWKAVDMGFRGALLLGHEDYTSFGDSNYRWDTFIDISGYLDRKMELLGAHRCQMPTAHLPDHGQRLRVMKWGAACGCRAAEVFTWVRRHDLPDLDATKSYYSPLIAELVKNTR